MGRPLYHQSGRPKGTSKRDPRGPLKMVCPPEQEEEYMLLWDVFAIGLAIALTLGAIAEVWPAPRVPRV